MKNNYSLTEFGYEYKPDIPKDRKHPDPVQVEAVRNVLSQCKKTNVMYSRHSSYGLKATFERYMDIYISNGAFIQAARLEGYVLDIVPPNAKINISKKSIKYLRNNYKNKNDE